MVSDRFCNELLIPVLLDNRVNALNIHTYDLAFRKPKHLQRENGYFTDDACITK